MFTPEVWRDNMQRRISYIRMSVTDRCDLRCHYCMAETMTFMPRHTLLNYEELVRIGSILAGGGVNKIRISGGEPLVRRDVPDLINELKKLQGIKTLALTTNGTHLARYAKPLREAGLDSINISLDSLSEERYRQITRNGQLGRVLEGIDAAIKEKFKSIRLNVVALKDWNDHECADLVTFALEHELDIAFIEEMPLGMIDRNRSIQLMPASEVRSRLMRHFDLIPSHETTSGPASYMNIVGCNTTRVGFIAPYSENFCAQCNRARLTAQGLFLPCLGHEQGVDLKTPLRQGANDDELIRIIQQALWKKPAGHEFFDLNAPQVMRYMNVTGG